MNLSRNRSGSLTLELSDSELLILKSCLREAFAALDKRDFPLRVGAPMEHAADIARELRDLMQRVGVEE